MCRVVQVYERLHLVWGGHGCRRCGKKHHQADTNKIALQVPLDQPLRDTAAADVTIAPSKTFTSKQDRAWTLADRGSGNQSEHDNNNIVARNEGARKKNPDSPALWSLRGGPQKASHPTDGTPLSRAHKKCTQNTARGDRKRVSPLAGRDGAEEQAVFAAFVAL